MDQVLARGDLSNATVKRIAERIWSFHEQAEGNEEITVAGSLETVRKNIEENFQQTREYIGITIPLESWVCMRAYSEAFMQAKEGMFRRREASGKVRDGHGDLHMDHVFLSNGIEIIDCIEFNDRYRYADVASDVAFLAMDLDYAKRPDLSRILEDAYVAASGDHDLLGVLDFYKCYRAYVRAKVHSLRLDQMLRQSSERDRAQQLAESYVALADTYARPSGPLLVITAGLMGTGKSQVARGLASALDADVLSTDIVRKELAGVSSTERHFLEWETGLYSPESLDETYEVIHERAVETLAKGRSVIMDASYRREVWRHDARRVAREAGVPFVAVERVCSPKLVRDRLESRLYRSDVSSDGRWEIYQQQAASFESVQEGSPHQHVIVDTAESEAETLHKALVGVYKGLMSSRSSTLPYLQTTHAPIRHWAKKGK